MNILDYAITWCKGEIFEAKLILAFAIGIMAVAVVFYMAGSTPSAKATLFPLLVVGLMFAAIGGGMLYNNPKRIVEFEKAYQEDPQAFRKSEINRTKDFISWYPITRYIMAGLGLIGVLVFIFWAAPIGRAIGISLILIMLATFVVDHFSEERAHIYLNSLEKQFNQN